MKAELAAAGEVFSSETDSEVIVKLIARAYAGDFFAAVSSACARLSGSYAIAVLCEDFPGEIVCARYKSPLVAGAGGGALYVCSDIPTLCGEAEYICTAADGEFIRICGGEIHFLDAAGREIPKTFSRVPPESRAQEKGRGSYMEREIAEIPRALADTLAGLKKTDFARCARVLRGAKRAFAVACGTAYHAALAFKDAAESDCGIPVLCHTSSEFRYRAPLVGCRQPERRNGGYAGGGAARQGAGRVCARGHERRAVIARVIGALHRRHARGAGNRRRRNEELQLSAFVPVLYRRADAFL